MPQKNYGSELSTGGAQYLRDALLNDDESLRIAAAVVQRAVEQNCDEIGVSDPALRRMFTQFAFQRAMSNMRLVFRHNRSPIERQFMGALVVGMSSQYPFGFLVTPASSDVEALTRAYAQGRSGYDCQRATIADHLADKSDLGFLNECIVRLDAGTLTPDVAQELAVETYIRALYDIRYALHATPQAKLPHVEVEGSAVIPDLMVWIPLRKDLRVIAECDGFVWHKDKGHFINDRKRDRALKFQGYDVHRFSGSEIYADAVTASKEFCDHLLLAISRLSPPLEQITRQLSDPAVGVLYIACSAVILAAEQARAT